MWPFSSKTTLCKSDLLGGATDCHTHLLPGVDDGFRTADDSLAALSRLESTGIRTVWLTPHIMEDIPNETDDLRRRFEEFAALYTGPIELHLAAEHMLDNLFLERFEKKDVLPIFDDCLLVETSYFNPPMGLDAILADIMTKGYRPLLAHPERYKYMGEDDYERLHSRGVEFQLNLGALTGGYSPLTQKKAEYLLRRGYYSRIGSDIHSLRNLEKILTTPLSTSSVSRVANVLNNK